MSTTSTILSEKTKELSTLLAPHRGTDVMQRINLFCVNETGKKLPDFVQSTDEQHTDERKIEIVDRLSAIAKAGSWQLLPAAPGGQANAAPKPGPAAAAPAPKPAAKPAPKPEPEAVKQEPAVAASQTATLPAVVTTPANTEAPEPESDDPAAQLAALIGKLTAKQPAKPSLTRDEIRLIVREEIAMVFSLAAGALNKK